MSDTETANARLRELKSWLVRRGYSARKVQRQIRRARGYSSNRDGPPTPRNAESEGRRVPLVVSYHPGLPDISNIIRRFEPVLAQSQVASALNVKSFVAFRQPPNIKSHLVRAKLRKNRSTPTNPKPDPAPCGRARCRLCALFVADRTIISHVTGNRHYCQNSGASCGSEWCVYAIACTSCGIQYVGSSNKLRLRMNNHKSALTSARKGGDNKTNCHRLYDHLIACQSNQETFKRKKCS